MKNKFFYKSILLSFALITPLFGAGCAVTDNISITYVTSDTSAGNENWQEAVSFSNVIETTADGLPVITWLDNLSIPNWDGLHAYVTINNNQPFFDTATLTTQFYENYYPLDSLGRCTLADAVVGPETQSSEGRGDISSVKPTGWRYQRMAGCCLLLRKHVIRPN